MIVRTGDADRFVAKPPLGLIAALVYGPDQGMVRERAERLAKSAAPDLSDPFRVVELDADTLDADPARLHDEAAAMTMTGGRRVVRVHGAGNALAKEFERLFEDRFSADTLIVVDAGDLAKTSALRRFFETQDHAAAIACYPDSGRDIRDIVRAELQGRGLAIEMDALNYLAARLGSDRGVTRSELEKLSLYALGETEVTIAHVMAAVGDESELRMEECADAAGEGDYGRLDKTLSRLWAAGTSPVAVLRIAIGHFQRLLAIKAEEKRGGDVASAIKRLRPPVHFSRADSFRRQLTRLSEAQLLQALALLYEGEALTKTTAVPAEAACGRALFTAAAIARKG